MLTHGWNFPPTWVLSQQVFSFAEAFKVKYFINVILQCSDVLYLFPGALKTPTLFPVFSQKYEPYASLNNSSSVCVGSAGQRDDGSDRAFFICYIYLPLAGRTRSNICILDERLEASLIEGIIFQRHCGRDVFVSLKVTLIADGDNVPQRLFRRSDVTAVVERRRISNDLLEETEDNLCAQFDYCIHDLNSLSLLRR